MGKSIQVKGITFTLFAGGSQYEIYPPDWNESIGFAENSDDAFDVAKNWMESAYDGGDAEAQGMTWEQVLKQ